MVQFGIQPEHTVYSFVIVAKRHDREFVDHCLEDMAKLGMLVVLSLLSSLSGLYYSGVRTQLIFLRKGLSLWLTRTMPSSKKPPSDTPCLERVAFSTL
jgi:hypothetical protein